MKQSGAYLSAFDRETDTFSVDIIYGSQNHLPYCGEVKCRLCKYYLQPRLPLPGGAMAWRLTEIHIRGDLKGHKGLDSSRGGQPTTKNQQPKTNNQQPTVKVRTEDKLDNVYPQPHFM